jgi:hypothetical protein
MNKEYRNALSKSTRKHLEELEKKYGKDVLAMKPWYFNDDDRQISYPVEVHDVSGNPDLVHAFDGNDEFFDEFTKFTPEPKYRTQFLKELGGECGEKFKKWAVSKIQGMKKSFENGEIVLDDNGAALWKESGNYIDADCCEVLYLADCGFSLSNCKKTALEQAKKAVQEEFTGYDNGHSEYMVVGVDREKFLEWAALKTLDPQFDEIIGNVRFDNGNGIVVARFSACEKYSPELNGIIEEAFPDAIVYGFGNWDSCIVEAPDGAYEASLDECFEDEGNLRIDVLITDKKSGCTGAVGDLVYFDSVEDVERAEGDETFAYLTNLIDQDELPVVYGKLDECKDYFLYDEEDEDVI